MPLKLSMDRARIKKLIAAPAFAWVGLMVFCFFAYSVLIPWLGYYGDDLSYLWLGYKSHQLPIFFVGNRPLLGQYFVLLTGLLGPAPWHWHLFELAARWLSALAFWAVLRRTWPGQPRLALAAAAFFCVYPAFTLNSEAMTFSPYFLQLAALFGSLLATLRGLQAWNAAGGPRRGPAAAWFGLALLGSLSNLLLSEYFYFLELLRYALVAWELRGQPGGRRQAWLVSLSFGLVFLAVLLLRVLGIGNVAGNYSNVLLQLLRTDPFQALTFLANRFVGDFWQVTAASLANALTFPGLAARSLPVMAGFAGLLAVIAAFTAGWLWANTEQPQAGYRAALRVPLQYLLVGLLLMMVAGVPVWAADLKLTFDMNSSRFSLAFIPGACLFVVGLWGLLPWASLRIAGFALAAAVFTGFQLLTGYGFILHKSFQADLINQITVRLPSVVPGTLFVINPGALEFNSENSNSGLLNLLYTPRPDGRAINVYALENEDRIRPAVDPYVPLPTPLEAHSTGDFVHRYTLVIYYHPPNCLRVLDPVLDRVNPDLPAVYRQFAGESTPAAVQLSPTPLDEALLAQVWGSTLRATNPWCLDFARAGLAAQQGDWAAVVSTAERILPQGNQAHNPLELAVFIEAYARTGRWEQAARWFTAALKMDPAYTPALCLLRQRLQPLPGAPDLQKALPATDCP